MRCSWCRAVACPRVFGLNILVKSQFAMAVNASSGFGRDDMRLYAVFSASRRGRGMKVITRITLMRAVLVDTPGVRKDPVK